IVVPTTQKSVPKTKPAKTLTKSRSVRSKTNTLAYYNCLIDQVANPLNDKVKITSMCHNCKHNKSKVEAARQEHKQQLVKEVAKNYQAFGESLALRNGELALRIAYSAFGTIALLLLMFCGYNLKLKKGQIDLGKRTEKLEKKNGHEQKQINELKKEVEQLKRGAKN
ncbi:9266_t:CDS:2, partial [Ambispora gerdemannii]